MDIISELKQTISPELLSSIAQSMGEPQAGVSKALGSIFPMLLGSIMNKASDPDSANVMSDLMGMIKNVPSPTDLLSNPASLLGVLTSGGQEAAGSLGNMATKLIPSLLGSKTQDALSFIANFAGIKASSVSSLLNMALPLIMSIVGKKAISGGSLSLGSLMSYLTSQKDSIINAAPAGLGNALGLGDFSQIGSNLTKLATEVSNVPAEAKKTPMLWLILIGALVIGGLFAWRSCSKQEVQNTVTQTVQEVRQGATTIATDAREGATAAVSAVREGATDALNTTSNAAHDLWAHLGKFYSHKLPNGTELNIPELGVENKLIGFINDASKPVDKTTWFSFDRLLFETSSATLKPDSDEQLKNIAEILKAYPNVEIKIGGYTDNTGNPQFNLKLSQERADSVMSELVALGIPANRITATGYGEEFPVVANDTPENRAMNRRIDIRVTNK